MKTKLIITSFALTVSIIYNLSWAFERSMEIDHKIMRNRAYDDIESTVQRSRETRDELAPKKKAGRAPASIIEEEPEEFNEEKLMKDVDKIIDDNDRD